VPLEQVLGSVEAARKLRLVIRDACRDNPVARQMRRTVASRSIGRGLGLVEPEGGTLVAYAAKHGEIALMRDDVMAAIERKQDPFVYGSLPGEDFFFVVTQ
jgi:uncharacterized caspase-like protein